MKKNLALFSYFAFALLFVFTSCNSEDPSPEDEALNELSGTWSINLATTPDGEITLSGVSVNFNADNATYSVTGIALLEENNLNLSDVFAEQGTFSLNADQTAIVLDGNNSLNYTITDNAITISYDSNFPKETSDPAQLTLTGSKSN
jgi:hypothetical protein